MTREDANNFAARWISAWNRKDVAAVLDHYVDDARFISPKAALFVGNPVVEGKAALANYWQLGAKKLDTIEFKLDRVLWDPDVNELVVFYEANLNGERSRACEVMKFNAAGKQISGEAMYGAAITG
jgi:ketosteroid isomerase-like protein